ncbi:hypothetical protein Dda_4227 [Drechslerella dactyloides]|uniref:CipC-like antibiotic response protein n=1 Tax=Drechslerella dactyloides TaxID=74499 RepID=A0AAD6J086_DREDA|nr:hypothetical protein Dda_4227 [Drechslerella dactyloides]
MSDWDSARDSYQQVHHEGKLGHELLAGAAAFSSIHIFEEQQRKKGEPVNHEFAKELLGGLAAMEADKLVETKGRDAWDRERVKRQAREQAENMYDQQYGGQDRHELLAAAAAFAAFHKFQQHQREQGRPVSHMLAKDLLAAFAAAEAEKMIETRDIGGRWEEYKDRAMELAREKSREMYHDRYEADHDSGDEMGERHRHHHRRHSYHEHQA